MGWLASLSTGCQIISRVKYLDGLFANASVTSGDNDDFPRQVRNVVDGELGFWSEVGFHKDRIEHPPEDAEGGEEAGAGHERSCCCRRGTLGTVGLNVKEPSPVTTPSISLGRATHAYLRLARSPLTRTGLLGNVQSESAFN